MLRLLGTAFRGGVLIALALAVALFVEPRWEREALTLTLRVRAPSEVWKTALGWGRQAWARRSGAAERPDVASGRAAPDQLTDEDRARLDRLIEEKLQE